MSAEERLRRYLEQRREMGESELVLDGMTVDDVMKVLGVARTRTAAGSRPERDNVEGKDRTRMTSSEQGRSSGPPAKAPAAGAPDPAGGDWRTHLRASGAAPSTEGSRRPPADTARHDRKGAPPVPADAARLDRRDAGLAPERPTHPDRDATPQGMEPSAAPGAAAHPTGKPASAPPPRPIETPRAPTATPGISIGGGGRQLFGGPFGALETLDAIAETVAACTRCPLHASATNPVPGEGNPDANLMIVGEAPGANEDATGRPFVGAAGQLLTKILEAINLRREDVFICNVLKHRPPDNRNPLPQEVEACSPYLVRQIELIRPKVILALGLFAAQTLLNSKLPLIRLRESVHRYYGIPLIVTYHPAALLRNPNWKRPTWEDVKLARRILDGSASPDA